MITIKDVARKCGVSASTVSRALADSKLLPEETKKRIKEAAKELGYIKNEMAKSLKTGVNKTVGIINFAGDNLGFVHYLFAGVLTGFSNAMNDMGYEILHISPTAVYDEKNVIRNIRSKHVSGIFILSGHLQIEGLRVLLESDIPTVVFDPREREILAMTDCVTSDNYGGMYALTAAAIKKGHTDIVYVCGEDYYVTEERVKGFKQALADNCVAFKDDMIVKGNFYNLSSVGDNISKILSRSVRPTCLLFSDDYCAVYAYEVLRGKNYRIGKDISIAGFDGIELAKHMQPKLTTVEQDSFSIGSRAADMLVSSITDGGKTSLACLPVCLYETESIEDRSKKFAVGEF